MAVETNAMRVRLFLCAFESMRVCIHVCAWVCSHSIRGCRDKSLVVLRVYVCKWLCLNMFIFFIFLLRHVCTESGWIACACVCVCVCVCKWLCLYSLFTCCGKLVMSMAVSSVCVYVCMYVSEWAGGYIHIVRIVVNATVL